MARGSFLRQLSREIERSNRETSRRRIALAREQARMARETERSLARATREEKRAYEESCVQEADDLTAEAEEELAHLEGLLADTFDVDDWLDLESLKSRVEVAPFQPGDLATPKPAPDEKDYVPRPPSGLSALFGSKRRYEEALLRGRAAYDAAVADHSARETDRIESLRVAREAWERATAAATEEITKQHAEIDDFRRRLESREPAAAVDYFAMVLERSNYPETFPRHAKIAYVPESSQLVIEMDLPDYDVIPAIESYKYVKARDEITEKALPETKRRALYLSVIAQVTIRTLHETFEADRGNLVDTIVFNGIVESIDRGTGRTVRPCVVTLRCTRVTFMQLDLKRVDPQACLKALDASVSKKPSELAPVRPVLEFNMVDPRFVDEVDVLSGLDRRQNLMELKPFEFENLISNLFQRMGLETRQTQASRDGGVDCVAFDPRPIFGGKVVIQAKRYKGTVGVSAVRDLFGTLQNEGASKGILVTTSGFGQASFEFARGKPLELLDGSNLLFLLAEHAGLEAKIEIPEDWVEPSVTS